MRIDPMEEMETDARNVRLNEQAIFRKILSAKKMKFKRILLLTIMVFSLVMAAWLLFHCVFHVFKF